MTAKARKGDLAILVRQRSTTYLHGKTEQRPEILLGVVERTNRAGLVGVLKTYNGSTYSVERGQRVAFVSAANLAVPPVSLVESILVLLGKTEIETIEQARALVAPWVNIPTIEPWPNGLGWDVAGHHVVVNPDGTRAAALVGLPEGVSRFQVFHDEIPLIEMVRALYHKA